jgi:hypothetical protein
MKRASLGSEKSLPSEYSVQSPSKVTRRSCAGAKGAGAEHEDGWSRRWWRWWFEQESATWLCRIANTCARLSTCRTSLNDGCTQRRELTLYLAS